MGIKWQHSGLALTLAVTACGLHAAPAGKPAAAVNVFIGTGGDGHTFPGATRPFGMVQLSPDTQVRHFRQSYPWAAGYRYDDDSILGFSHTHFSGAGHSDRSASGSLRLTEENHDREGHTVRIAA